MRENDELLSLLLSRDLPKLQKVIIKTLLRDANVLGGLLQCDTLLCVHAAPLAHLNHHFTYDALFLTTASEGLTRLVAPLNQRVRVLGSSFKA